MNTNRVINVDINKEGSNCGEELIMNSIVVSFGNVVIEVCEEEEGSCEVR